MRKLLFVPLRLTRSTKMKVDPSVLAITAEALRPCRHVDWVRSVPGTNSFMDEMRDKARNKVQEAKGKVKEAAGRATGNRDLKAKGKADRKKGNVKQAGEKAKDTFRK